MTLPAMGGGGGGPLLTSALATLVAPSAASIITRATPAKNRFFIGYSLLVHGLLHGTTLYLCDVLAARAALFDRLQLQEGYAAMRFLSGACALPPAVRSPRGFRKRRR